MTLFSYLIKNNNYILLLIYIFILQNFEFKEQPIIILQKFEFKEHPIIILQTFEFKEKNLKQITTP